MKNLTIRLDEDLKLQAEELFRELGLNMTSAITVFLRKAVREQRIPFEVGIKPSDNDWQPSPEELEKLLYEKYPFVKTLGKKPEDITAEFVYQDSKDKK